MRNTKLASAVCISGEKRLNQAEKRFKMAMNSEISLSLARIEPKIYG